MQSYKMKPGENCHLACAAMLLDVDYYKLRDTIGHTGNELLGGKRRGFHNQEIIDCFVYYGLMLSPIELYPCLGTQRCPKTIYSHDFANNRFNTFIKNCEGIIMCMTHNDVKHAIAFDHGDYCDPRYGVYQYNMSEDVRILEAWVVTEMI